MFKFLAKKLKMGVLEYLITYNWTSNIQCPHCGGVIVVQMADDEELDHVKENLN